MKMPPGFYGDSPTKVCKLRKSLYGLKQTPRCWFAKLSDALKRFGFKQSYFDYSLFTIIKGGRSLRVLVYVDDLILVSNDMNMLTKFKAYLSDCFKMKDRGKAKYFLGIEMVRRPMGMFLTQRKYALEIVAESGLLGCKPDCHSVRDAVQNRLIKMRHVRTTQQLADIITKALGSMAFHYLMNKLGVRNLHAST